MTRSVNGFLGRGLTVAAVALSLAAVAAARPESVVRETARAGEWSANFTYVRGASSGPSYSGLHLTVLDGPNLVLDAPVVSRLAGATYLQPGGGFGKSISFRDLDADGTPELLLALFTGGAHCCSVEQVFNLASSRPKKAEISFLDAEAKIEKVGTRTIFRSADDFGYVFTDYAESGFPIQIWSYRHARFTDTTRQFPTLIRKDAAYWWSTYRHVLKSHGDERGILSAWAADEALLGRATRAKQTLLQIAFSGALDKGYGGAKGSSYVRALWRFLAKKGYVPR